MEFKQMDWCNPDLLDYIINEVFVPTNDWPEGVTAEEAVTKEADIYGKWSESTVRILVDGALAVEMEFSGKYGDSLKCIEIKDRKALAEMLGRIVTMEEK